MAILSSPSPPIRRGWQAWVVNWLYFTRRRPGQGDVRGGHHHREGPSGTWSSSLDRLPLSRAFLPFSFLLFLPMLTLGEDFFPWIGMIAEGDYIVERKAASLNTALPLGPRNIVGTPAPLGILNVLFLPAVRPDLGSLEGRPDRGSSRAKWREVSRRLFAGTEVEEVRRLAPGLASALGRLAVLLLSRGHEPSVSVDLGMSLDPHCFSTTLRVVVLHGGLLGGDCKLRPCTQWSGFREGTPTSAKAHRARSKRHESGKLAFGFPRPSGRTSSGPSTSSSGNESPMGASTGWWSVWESPGEPFAW